MSQRLPKLGRPQTAAEYFRQANRPVLRGELLSILENYDRATRREWWLNRYAREAWGALRAWFQPKRGTDGGTPGS
jgi:hypothetical protein